VFWRKRRDQGSFPCGHCSFDVDASYQLADRADKIGGTGDRDVLSHIGRPEAAVFFFRQHRSTRGDGRFLQKPSIRHASEFVHR
jgi:hypothetical protein